MEASLCLRHIVKENYSKFKGVCGEEDKERNRSTPDLLATFSCFLNRETLEAVT